MSVRVTRAIDEAAIEASEQPRCGRRTVTCAKASACASRRPDVVVTPSAVPAA